MNSASVWGHRPSADELLDARLARGWAPIASSMKEGERILGHAACRVTPPR